MTAAGWVALTIAIAGAFCYAAGSILQAVGAQRSRGTVRTMGHPLYLIGVVFDLLAWAGSMVALRELAVYLVESVLASSLAITVVLARLILKSRLRGRDVAAVLISVGALIVLAMSAGEQESVPPSTGLRVGFCGGAVIMMAIGWGAAKIAPPGVVAGVSGLSLGAAALAGRALTLPADPAAHVGTTVLALVTEPLTWSLLVFAIGGMVMYTFALQHGQVGPVTSVLWIGEVIAPSAIALFMMGDTVRPGWELRAGLAGLVVVAAAVVLATAPATSETVRAAEGAPPEALPAARPPAALPAGTVPAEPLTAGAVPAGSLPAGVRHGEALPVGARVGTALPADAQPAEARPAGSDPWGVRSPEALPVGARALQALPAGVLRSKNRPVRRARRGIRRADVVWPAVPGDRRIPVQPIEAFALAAYGGPDPLLFADDARPGARRADMVWPPPPPSRDVAAFHEIAASHDVAGFGEVVPSRDVAAINEVAASLESAGADRLPVFDDVAVFRDPAPLPSREIAVSRAELEAAQFAGPGAVALPERGAVALPEPSAVMLPEPSAVALPEPDAVAFGEPGAVPYAGPENGDGAWRPVEKIIWWGPAPIWIPPRRAGSPGEDGPRPEPRSLPEPSRHAVEAPRPVPELTWHPPHRDQWMWGGPPADADAVDRYDPEPIRLEDEPEPARPWQDMFRDDTRQPG
jgi:drug/metabolite transporter (DMT)-like permease